MQQAAQDQAFSDEARTQFGQAFQPVDSLPEAAYDDFVKIAAALCAMPIAIITCGDAEQQRFLAASGLEPTPLPRTGSLWTAVVTTAQPLLVADTESDPCFAAHPWVVNAPNIRAYVGLPLLSDAGTVLGSLAVCDRVPRHLSAEHLSLLEALARQIAGLIERHHEHQQARLATARLTLAQKVGQMGSWELDLDTDRLVWSTEVYRIFGVEPHTFSCTVEAFMALVHPNDQAALLAAQARAIAGEAMLDLDHRIIRPNGEIRYVRERGQLVRGEATLTPLLLGTVQDITAAKIAQTQQQRHLRELNYAYDSLRFHINNSPLAVVEWDASFRVSRWTAQAESVFGWREADVLGCHPSEWRFVHPDDLPLLQQSITPLLKGVLKRNSYACRAFDCNGVMVYCEWYNSVQRDAQGQLSSIFSLIHNVSDRVAAEQKMAAALTRERTALADAEATTAHFRALFETTPGCYIVLEPTHFDIVAVSDSYLAATHTLRDQIMGRCIFDVFPDDRPEADGVSNLRASLERVKSQKRADVMDVQRYPIPSIDGSGFEERFWSPLNSPVFGPKGDLVCIVHRAEDVTEYLRHQEHLGERKAAWLQLESRPQLMEADIVMRSQELQHLNDQLRRYEDQFRRMFAAAATGIVATDLKGQITNANVAFCHLLGYSEAAMLTRNIWGLIHPDDQPLNQSLLQELLRGDRNHFVIEQRYLTQAGESVWCRVSVAAERDDTAHPIGLVAVSEDISQQRSMAEQLSKSRALARIAGRLGRLGGWAADLSHNQIYWSEEVFRILEWPSDTAPSLDQALTYYVPTDRECLNDAIAACTQAGTPFDLELELHTGAGRHLWARILGEAERDGTGEIVRVVGALQDISPQKQAESALDRLATRLQTTLENMADAFYLLDEQWQFVYLNPQAEQVLQVKASTVLGRSVWDCFPEARPSPLYDTYHQAVRDGQTQHFEFYFAPLAQWFEITAYPSSEGLAVYFRVITERISLEEQLRQAQRLESIGQLTGGIAHDFNNLLTVILGNAELMREFLASDSALHPLADMIVNAAQRGAQLTQRLLAFARRQALDPKPTDVNTLIGAMAGLLRRSLGEQIDIELVLGPDLWLALIDPVQLESSLLNLSINARDAMPAGGHLMIETSNRSIDEADTHHHLDIQSGHYVVITVSDRGQGIAPDDLARVFEPFFTTKEQGKGTGLGLSMVYGFVKQSNGHITINSEVNHGTTIRMYLPRHRGEAIAAITPDTGIAIVVSSGGGEQILLVEDDDLVRRYAQHQLEQLGYKVTVANGGKAALAIIQNRHDFDLLFTDIMMPGGMNGRELVDQIRELQPDIKVLFTSGYSDTAIVHQGRLDTGVHLLSKPYGRLELAQKLREVLDMPAEELGNGSHR